MSPFGYRRPARRTGWGCAPRLMIAGVVALFSIISYCSLRTTNPITQETQYVAMTVPQEIALGLQAAPELAAQFGGMSGDAGATARVKAVGRRIVERSAARGSEYEFDFHLLADPQTINAFALPGGQVFITEALYRRLETEGQLAGVLGHEVGHVIARHAGEHLAKARLTEGLTGAAVIATYDPENPSSRGSAAVAMLVGQLVNLKYGRDDEIESDRLGVRFASEAGYDPRAMLAVMRVLAEASEGGRQPEFFSTHPNPDRRIERIEAAIEERFPQGVPADLQP